MATISRHRQTDADNLASRGKNTNKKTHTLQTVGIVILNDLGLVKCSPFCFRVIQGQIKLYQLRLHIRPYMHQLSRFSRMNIPRMIGLGLQNKV